MKTLRRALGISLLLATFALAPAGLTLHWERKPFDPWSSLVNEARAQKAVLEASLDRWLPRYAGLAQRLGGLLGQLYRTSAAAGDNATDARGAAATLGNAATATLMQYLERELRSDPDATEYAFVDRQGRLQLSTEQSRTLGVRTVEMPEVAQAAKRATLTWMRDRTGQGQMMIATPIQADGVLIGILTATLSYRLNPIGNRVPPSLIVGGNGVVVGRAPRSEMLTALGARGQPERLTMQGRPAAVEPLASARATVVTIGHPAPRRGIPQRYLLALAMISALSVIGGLFLARRCN